MNSVHFGKPCLPWPQTLLVRHFEGREKERLSPKHVYLFPPSALPLGEGTDQECEAVVDVLVDQGEQGDRVGDL